MNKIYDQWTNENLTDQQRYYRRHRQAELDRTKRWSENNEDKRRGYSRRRQEKKSFKEYQRKYRKNHLKVYSERQKKYSETHPKVIKAQNYAKYHCETSSDCEVCGSTENLERHHPDYSEPLMIMTVCRKCHNHIHRRVN